MNNCTSIFERTQSLPKGNKDEIILLGDININVNVKNAKGRIPPVVNKFVNKYSLRPLIKVSTRISSVSTIIDHVYTNSCNTIILSTFVN